jgi:chromate transporter
MKSKVSLKYLFFTFLKIGATSWGGFMALISVVQKNLVERDKVIEDEEILDGISLASVLPGPVAFNVISFLGYRLRGMKGALVSMAAILLPSFILILFLTFIYFEYGQLPVFENFFSGVLPAVSAIIISVAFSMSKKHLKDYKQFVICVVAALSLILFQAFYITMLIMAVGAILGYLFYHKSAKSDEHEVSKNSLTSGNPFIYIAAIFLLVFLIWFVPYLLDGEIQEQFLLQRKIAFTFSGMSLTLFGGGYVIIPSIQEIVVNSLHWLNNKEFTDAIAMGQITPGPIFISATFIGYKVGGFIGAVTATLAIFLPPGFLMVFASRFMDFIKQSKKITAVFKGLRPAVIGMIFAAAYTIGKDVEQNWISILIFLAVLIASIRFNVNVVYLIPLSGVLGLILYTYA